MKLYIAQFIVWIVFGLLTLVMTIVHGLSSLLLQRNNNKFAFCSRFVPPLWSGQAIVIGRLLHGLSPDNYCLISRPLDGVDESFQKRLPGVTHMLKPEKSIPFLRNSSIMNLLNLLFCAIQRGFRIARVARRERVGRIVACSGDLVDPLAAWFASRLIGAKLYMAFFDDFTLQWWADQKMVGQASRIEHFVCRDVDGMIAPNEAMCETARFRHRKPAFLVRNPAPAKIPPVTKAAWPAKPGELHLVFTGAVYHLNVASLQAIGNALDLLAKEFPELSARLDIYTAQDHESLKAQGLVHPRVVLHNHVPPEDAALIQQQADILLIPFTLSPEADPFISSSATGKLADYLATARPVLAICPHQSFLGHYFRNNDCGTTVESNKPEDIGAAISAIIKNDKQREAQGKHARELAETVFSQSKAQADLLIALDVPFIFGGRLGVRKNRVPNPKSPFRILHISGFDLIGAQANGYLIHDYLLEHNIDSRMAVANKTTTDPTIISLRRFPWEHLNYVLTRHEAKTGSYSFMATMASQLRFMECYNKADIVHLHLPHVVPFFRLGSIPAIARKKKLVFSIHDMFMMTGHCVYALDCPGWRFGCGNCPDLLRSFAVPVDRTEEIWRKKYAIMHKARVQLVAGSPLLMQEIRQSPIMRDQPVEYIPYGINTEVFSNPGRAECRSSFGIPENAFVLCFRAVNRVGDIKGTNYIVEALKMLAPERPVWCLTLDCTGVVDGLKDKYTVREYGWVKDENVLARILSAADLLLMPSVGEGFGLMATEAMSCGTPVVVFEGTALPETVGAPHSGVAVPRSSAALAKAIRDLMHDKKRWRKLSANGIEHVKEKHNFENYAKSHLDLYERLMSS